MTTKQRHNQAYDDFLHKDKYAKDVMSPISVGMDPVSELGPEI
jgi:hypothetical protein